MSRHLLMLLVVAASLVAGGCAGKVYTVSVTPPMPAVPVVQEQPLIELPVMELTFNELMAPFGDGAVAAVPEEPKCDLVQQIEKAWTLTERVPLNVGTKVYRYVEKRAGNTMTFQDPEKDIALALLNPDTCTLSVVTITKRGADMDVPDGFDIEPVIRSNGIRWNNWATEFRVNEPPGLLVIGLKYPFVTEQRVPRVTKNKAGRKVTVYDTKKVAIPIFYTPYSHELHAPELVDGGRHYLTALAARAYEDLRAAGVNSEAEPGALVSDVKALKPEYVARLAPNEHMDMTEFLLDPVWTTERIHIVIGANRERVASYTCSKAGACGLMQFTAGTYAFMRAIYPKAQLIADFEDGARDPFNAMKAAILLHDNNISQLRTAFGTEILSDPKLEEYLAAAYNTGVGRVIAVLGVAKRTHAADWAEVSGTKKGERLLAETKGYIAKLRFMRDGWDTGTLAKATQ